LIKGVKEQVADDQVDVMQDGPLDGELVPFQLPSLLSQSVVQGHNIPTWRTALEQGGLVQMLYILPS
jgi:hypothetical protein